MKMAKKEVDHQWDYCGLCKCPFVRCRTCGNNCCSGTTDCDDCDSAYEMQENETPPEFSEEYIQEAIRKSNSFYSNLGL